MTVHIKDSVVNFYQVVEVPERILKEPAYFRLRAKDREKKHNRRDCLPDTWGSLKVNDAMLDLFARWEKEAEEEAKAGDGDRRAP